MRRRPIVRSLSDEIPERLRTQTFVEDWLSAAEIEAHTFGPGCRKLGPARCDGNCVFVLEVKAVRRLWAAQQQWREDHAGADAYALPPAGRLHFRAGSGGTA